MVGLSLVDALKQPARAGPPWTVYGLARRSPPAAQSTLRKLDRFLQLDVLDRAATQAALGPLAPRVTHLFWVTLAERATDDATSAANSAMLVNVLDALAGHKGSRLRHVALQTGTRHYYWAHLCAQAQAQIQLLVPFKEEAPRTSCRLFYYDLEDILVNYSSRLTWTVHRCSAILGASDRSLYNVLLTLAIYALICKHEGAPLVFPGTPHTWLHFCDVSDAGLVAEQQIWAGTTEGAANQAFNCTNGDVFTWRSFWKVLCEQFDVELVECGLSDAGASDWVSSMMGKGPVWAEIVRENGLTESRLEEITSFRTVWLLVNLEFQHVSCMNKSREFGFVRSVDSLKSVKKWVSKLREMNIIPKA